MDEFTRLNRKNKPNGKKPPLLWVLVFFLGPMALWVNATKISEKYISNAIYTSFFHIFWLASLYSFLLFPLFLLVKYLIFQRFNSFFMHCRVGSSCKYLNEIRKKTEQIVHADCFFVRYKFLLFAEKIAHHCWVVHCMNKWTRY